MFFSCKKTSLVSRLVGVEQLASGLGSEPGHSCAPFQVYPVSAAVGGGESPLSLTRRGTERNVMLRPRQAW